MKYTILIVEVLLELFSNILCITSSIESSSAFLVSLPVCFAVKKGLVNQRKLIGTVKKFMN